MPDKRKVPKPSKKETNTKKESEEKTENPYGGLPDVDLKKFLGCGG